MNEPDWRDFSQAGEQSAILEHTPRTGRFLDVGAWDAFAMSNVRALYEDGWGGVLVEPNPSHAARLRDVYRFSAAVRVLEVAVGPRSAGPTARFQMTLDATSTGDPETFAKWQGEVAYTGEAEVAVVAMPSLWASHGPFDFVSIDAEGWSGSVFMDLVAQCRPFPACICVEHDGAFAALEKLAWNDGYKRVLLNGTNLVLARR